MQLTTYPTMRAFSMAQRPVRNSQISTGKILPLVRPLIDLTCRPTAACSPSHALVCSHFFPSPGFQHTLPSSYFQDCPKHKDGCYTQESRFLFSSVVCTIIVWSVSLCSVHIDMPRSLALPLPAKEASFSRRTRSSVALQTVGQLMSLRANPLCADRLHPAQSLCRGGRFTRRTHDDQRR